MWNEEDGFYFDVLHVGDTQTPLKVRSMVGLIPLFAVLVLEPEMLERVPGFRSRMEWFIQNRPDLQLHLPSMQRTGMGQRRLLAILNEDRLRRILHRMLDENEFLGTHGIRSLSKYHKDHPYIHFADGVTNRVDYEPRESTSGLFGGNSSWRGSIWFPMNYLIIHSLQRFHYYFGDDFTVECPTGSGKQMHLYDVSMEIAKRLVSLFTRNSKGVRPALLSHSYNVDIDVTASIPAPKSTVAVPSPPMRPPFLPDSREATQEPPTSPTMRSKAPAPALSSPALGAAALSKTHFRRTSKRVSLQEAGRLIGPPSTSEGKRRTTSPDLEDRLNRMSTASGQNRRSQIDAEERATERRKNRNVMLQTDPNWCDYIPFYE